MADTKKLRKNARQNDFVWLTLKSVEKNCQIRSINTFLKKINAASIQRAQNILLPSSNY